MAPLTTLLALSLPALINAHGHVSGIVADGKWYTGWDAAMKYQNPIPVTAAWQADNLDNGFIAPSAFSTADIICHKSSQNGGTHIPVTAGSKVTFQWSTWPDSHKGPVIDYIASCNGNCSTVSAASLKFSKIDQGAWLSGSNPGTWVTDTLISSNFSWTTTIPAKLAPGKYVIRHEIIALHSAGQQNGAQAYPQCINFDVKGSGSTQLSGGVPATSFYTPTDPGILFNLYTTYDGTAYKIPGPALAALKKREEREHARDFAQ